MKKLILVILTLILIMGLFATGIYASETRWTVDFNYYYGGWDFPDNANDPNTPWRLYGQYAPYNHYSIADGKYRAYTTLLIDSTDTAYWSHVSTTTASGSIKASTGYTPNGVYVNSGNAVGPYHEYPVSAEHRGIRNFNSSTTYVVDAH